MAIMLVQTSTEPVRISPDSVQASTARVCLGVERGAGQGFQGSCREGSGGRHGCTGPASHSRDCGSGQLCCKVGGVGVLGEALISFFAE